MIYDGFLIIALLLLGTLPLVMLNQGEAVVGNILYTLYLFFIMFFYYAWQWRNGGQTLAMVTWRIKLVSMDTQQISWRQCFIRFITGAFGLSIFSALLNKNKTAIHDYCSSTRCIGVE